MKEISLYNTSKRKKEKFNSIKEQQVGMYVCGVTVYDKCHIGHGRAYTVFDTIRRFLEYVGYNVNYVQNFTDVDDKIIKKANETGKDYLKVSEENIAEYFNDMDSLNIKRATVYPKATEHISEMINMISGLIEKGNAYETDGDVYFSIKSFSEYGKLSGRDVDEMRAGARVDVNSKKKHPMDFVLWKASKVGEPSWDSPWGKGRPGWHIECSAMSEKYLGEQFDIHGGGADLIFPHHENEVAQSEASHGKDFVKYWMHNGFVNIDKEKMSKSLGNFFTIRDVLNDYSPEVLRLFYLMTHYRKPINYSLDQLDDAVKAYSRLSNAYFLKETVNKIENKGQLDAIKEKFLNSMSDDFNTAGALGVAFELVKIINSSQNSLAQILLKELVEDILGIKMIEPEGSTEDVGSDVLSLLEERTQARLDKNWVRADELKSELMEMGYVVKDLPGGKSELINS